MNYRINDDGKTCRITGQGSCKDKDIVIPGVVNGYHVTGICTEQKDSNGEVISGFDTNITSMVIPDSVTSIGSYAFQCCVNLASIHYKGTVEQWKKFKLDKILKKETSVSTIQCADGEVTVRR